MQKASFSHFYPYPNLTKSNLTLHVEGTDFRRIRRYIFRVVEITIWLWDEPSSDSMQFRIMIRKD